MQAYYDVIEAENGQQALEMAQTEGPDLILLDVMMPGIDGFEVCERLKSDPRTLHVPVVMLTALDNRDDKVRGLEVGADDFVSKPFEDVALMSRVSSLIRMKMMVDELVLREENASRLNTPQMVEAARATAFPGCAALLVSPSADTVRTISEALERETQCRVDTAVSIAQAQDMLGENNYDAILIDDDQQDEDPLRFGSMVRARPETRQAATLLISAAGDLSTASKALELGFSDYITRPLDLVELITRVRSQLRRKLYADKLRENMRNTIVQAVTDSLTGTYNRRYANTHLDALIDRCRESGSDLAIMILDIDRFKLVNDTHGHAAGDAVLKEFAQRLQNNVRGMDLVARMGGEEFMVIMPEVSQSLVNEVAERVRKATEDAPFELTPGDGTRKVTVSIGVAVLKSTESVFELIKRADDALYASKNNGRNMVTFAADAA